jgi:hypothetical protein
MSDFKPNLPDAVAIDANGYWWRVWGENPMWSMAPVNPDNSPIPQPVKFYRLVEFSPGDET